MRSEGGYNLVSKGCGMLFFGILALIVGMAAGTPIAAAIMLLR